MDELFSNDKWLIFLLFRLRLRLGQRVLRRIAKQFNNATISEVEQ